MRTWSLLPILTFLLLAGCDVGKFHARSGKVASTQAPLDRFDLGDETITDDGPDGPDFEIGIEPVEFRARWDGKHPDADLWTRATVTAIDIYGEHLLTSSPEDIKSYCPRFASLGREEKKAFWVQMISAIAEKENGKFDPALAFKETFKNSKGEFVMSRGLLQLSFESANNYGCGFKTEAALENPQKNLACGVRILDHWVRRENVMSQREEDEWMGPAKYWSVLRKSKTREFISTATATLPICHSNSI
jgi:Transglycosylase SLT domain